MRLVIALGGNALLRRGEPMTAQVQRANVRLAAQALAPIVQNNQVVITHGNGPQIGLLALQQISGAAPDLFPLDVLGAETEGMIGYLIEQELSNVLPTGKLVASLLTRVLVDRRDPAFEKPTKFVGPSYDREKADEDTTRRQRVPSCRNGQPRRRAFGTANARAIRHATPAMLEKYAFPAGSMGPKVEAACSFVNETGGFAAIGALDEIAEILNGEAGTRVDLSAKTLETG